MEKKTNSFTDDSDSQEELANYDGGFGWVIVGAAFSVQFFVLGMMNNYGILFTKLLEEFQESKQATSWVGSINYGLMFMSGPIATSLCERVGCRVVGVAGALIGAVGTLLASFSNDLVKMYLTEGFLFGVGASLCYFPSVVILPQYFSRRLSLANGLASCGSGIGTMAMGPIINSIVEAYGWRVYVRVSTGLMIFVAVISCLYKNRVPIKRRENDGRPLFDYTIFQNKAFVVFTMALFVFMLSYFVPFVHLTQMALEFGIPMEKGSLLVGFMSVGSTVGRLFFGKIADSARINRLYVYQIAMLGMGVSNTLCPLLTDFTGLVVYCAVFGFFEGCYVCQVAVITGDIVGVERLAVGVGTLFGIKSIPLTLGPPLAGMLYDISHSYQVAFLFAGAVPIVASLIMFAIPFLMPPPDHKFWKRRFNYSSKQYLINSSSEESSTADTNNSNNIGNDQQFSGVDTDKLASFRDNIARSFTSINKYRLDVDRKISIKELGSVASFGSIIFSPNMIKRNLTQATKPSSVIPLKSTSLVVVDRMTIV